MKEGEAVVEKETDCVVPEERVEVIVLVIDCPWVTDLEPELEREKSKEGGGGGGGGAVPVNSYAPKSGAVPE